MKIVGIDNGLSGALVCLEHDPHTDSAQATRVVGRLVMPTIQVTRNDHERNDYNLDMLRQAFRTWRPDVIYVEEAQAMPSHVQGRTQGVGSSFCVGLGFGLMRGLLAGLGYIENKHVFRVRPQRWQKEMFNGLARDATKKDTKALSAAVCRSLFAGVDWRATVKCHKPHSGLTDAACIAEFGRRHYIADRMAF